MGSTPTAYKNTRQDTDEFVKIDSVPDGWDIKRVQYEWDIISSWIVARYPSIEDMPTTHDVTCGIKTAQDILYMIKKGII